MRSIWKGTISFGMVAIPAKLYTAAEDRRVSFHLVHRECRGRVQLPRWCSNCERKLEPTEIQRVYEYAKGQYVPMEDADFQALPLKTLRTVEVVEFVESGGIDPRVFEKSYFLAPDEMGGKPFRLLLRAMEETGLLAVGKLAYREREHLSLLRPYGKLLLLHTLFYADELRDPQAIPVPEAAVSEKELSMALSLVKALKTDGFDLSKYQDDYRQALYELIEARIAGEEVERVEVPAPTGAGDLESSLMASIEAILAKKGVEA
ncbi:MAG: Ku protein [Dehalococcoidia bacterium]